MNESMFLSLPHTVYAVCCCWIVMAVIMALINLPVGRQRRVVGVVAGGGLEAGAGPRRHVSCSASIFQCVGIALERKVHLVNYPVPGVCLIELFEQVTIKKLTYAYLISKGIFSTLEIQVWKGNMTLSQTGILAYIKMNAELQKIMPIL